VVVGVVGHDAHVVVRRVDGQVLGRRDVVARVRGDRLAELVDVQAVGVLECLDERTALAVPLLDAVVAGGVEHLALVVHTGGEGVPLEDDLAVAVLVDERHVRDVVVVTETADLERDGRTLLATLQFDRDLGDVATVLRDDVVREGRAVSVGEVLHLEAASGGGDAGLDVGHRDRVVAAVDGTALVGALVVLLFELGETVEALLVGVLPAELRDAVSAVGHARVDDDVRVTADRRRVDVQRDVVVEGEEVTVLLERGLEAQRGDVEVLTRTGGAAEDDLVGGTAPEVVGVVGQVLAVDARAPVEDDLVGLDVPDEHLGVVAGDCGVEVDLLTLVDLRGARARVAGALFDDDRRRRTDRHVVEVRRVARVVADRAGHVDLHPVGRVEIVDTLGTQNVLAVVGSVDVEVPAREQLLVGSARAQDVDLEVAGAQRVTGRVAGNLLVERELDVAVVLVRGADLGVLGHVGLAAATRLLLLCLVDHERGFLLDRGTVLVGHDDGEVVVALRLGCRQPPVDPVGPRIGLEVDVPEGLIRPEGVGKWIPAPRRRRGLPATEQRTGAVVRRGDSPVLEFTFDGDVGCFAPGHVELDVLLTRVHCRSILINLYCRLCCCGASESHRSGGYR